MAKKSLEQFEKHNTQMPLVAILRGITTNEAISVTDVLVESGFTIMEVTLNSPEPYESIKRIHRRHGEAITLGAGTVLNATEVTKVKDAGGDLIISPNLNLDVVATTLKQSMVSVPGCFTPSEAFTALAAGADVIKIFPADALGVGFIKGIRAVLPTGTRLCPTGGVTNENISSFIDAGAHSMGIGSALFQPNKSVTALREAAEAFVNAVNHCLDKGNP